MKKIINGKKYDTDTAKEICACSNGLYSEIYGYQEVLYKKRTGEFFLYGEGGAGSKYGVHVGNNSYSSGEEIKPFTEAEARKWMERHATVEEYEALFGTVEE